MAAMYTNRRNSAPNLPSSRYVRPGDKRDAAAQADGVKCLMWVESCLSAEGQNHRCRSAKTEADDMPRRCGINPVTWGTGRPLSTERQSLATRRPSTAHLGIHMYRCANRYSAALYVRRRLLRAGAISDDGGNLFEQLRCEIEVAAHAIYRGLRDVIIGRKQSAPFTVVLSGPRRLSIHHPASEFWGPGGGR